MNRTEFREELSRDLTENILPYWTGRMADPVGVDISAVATDMTGFMRMPSGARSSTPGFSGHSQPHIA